MEIAPLGRKNMQGGIDMKRILLTLIPCLLVGAAVFFTVNHGVRARLIVAAAGELPDIPGCPLHESCVKALQEERAASLPLFPAGAAGSLAAFAAGAFLLAGGKRREIQAAV
jgi:hypothetical protein